MSCQLTNVKLFLETFSPPGQLGVEYLFISFLMKTDKGRQWWWWVQYWFCPAKSDHRGNGDSIAPLYYFQQPSPNLFSRKEKMLSFAN